MKLQILSSLQIAPLPHRLFLISISKEEFRAICFDLFRLLLFPRYFFPQALRTLVFFLFFFFFFYDSLSRVLGRIHQKWIYNRILQLGTKFWKSPSTDLRTSFKRSMLHLIHGGWEGSQSDLRWILIQFLADFERCAVNSVESAADLRGCRCAQYGTFFEEASHKRENTHVTF